MIRVLHIIPSLDIEEVKLFQLWQIVRSQGNGYIHAVVSLRPYGIQRKFFHEKDIELVTLDISHSPVTQLLGLVTLIRNTRPDIIQTWSFFSGIFGGFAAKIAGNTNVIWNLCLNDLVAGEWHTKLFARSAVPMILGQVPQAIVCTCETVQQGLVALGYSPERMIVIETGYGSRASVSAQQTFVEHDEQDASNEPLKVGYLGLSEGYTSQSNITYVADIFAKSLGNVHFLFLKKEVDPENKKRRSTFQDIHIAEHASLLVSCSDISTIMCEADVLCLPSLTGVYANLLHTALAMGKPCVLTGERDTPPTLEGMGVLGLTTESAIASRHEARTSIYLRNKENVLKRKNIRYPRAVSTKENARERFESLYKAFASNYSRAAYWVPNTPNGMSNEVIKRDL